MNSIDRVLFRGGGGVAALMAVVCLAQAPASDPVAPSIVPPPPLPPAPSRPLQASNVTVVRVPKAVPNALPPPVVRSISPAKLAPAPVGEQLPLVWDLESKQYDAKPGETTAEFSFNFTNPTPRQVIITEVRPSCGCTVPKLPSTPWTIEPGGEGKVDVTVDFRGKRGLLAKMVYVHAHGFMPKSLMVRVSIPEPDLAMGDRTKNLQIAAADRQAVFRNDCAKCHAEPAQGKKGAELYTAACAICHDAEHRASMVPDLRALPHPTSREHWLAWITHGKPGTLMPAFAKANDGILDEAQIRSLTDYLTEAIPSKPAASASLPASR